MVRVPAHLPVHRHGPHGLGGPRDTVGHPGGPQGRRVRVRRDVPVPMPDGVTLLADHYAPVGADRPPTILIRTPYGRGGVVGWMYGWTFARHGFQVLLQSCRGGFGSGGRLDPLVHEQADGLATVEWMRAQSWYGGSFAMHGPSYLGYTQWAIAAETPDLRAMAVQVTASCFRDAAYVGGSFALESTLIWTTLTAHLEGRLGGVAAFIAPGAHGGPCCRAAHCPSSICCRRAGRCRSSANCWPITARLSARTGRRRTFPRRWGRSARRSR
ncbi:hypothetical protein GCM10027612_47020 [Microbispora bryophytorum subsp. camponoti]